MLGRHAATRWRAPAPTFRLPTSPSPSPPAPSIRTRLASTSTQPRSKPTRKRWRTFGAVGLATAAVFAYDKEFNADAISRSLRTAAFGITLAADFKLNFDVSKPDQVDALHERTARRLAALIDDNKGLYIKLGQAMAIQAAILPKPYRDALGGVFDAAPKIEWDEVVRVFRGEFGVDPGEAFEHFEREPLASASIAQVHRARLKPVDGRPWKDDEGWVAVKIRKEAVPKQMEWCVLLPGSSCCCKTRPVVVQHQADCRGIASRDLFCYRALLWTYERLFDLPVAFISQYISEQMRKEANLKTEASNAERTARYLADEPSLRDRATVPKVNWQWTGESVMTAECVSLPLLRSLFGTPAVLTLTRGCLVSYVNACRLTDKDRIAAAGFSLKQVMDTATEVFSAMVFKWGFVRRHELSSRSDSC